jgi:glucokinase
VSDAAVVVALDVGGTGMKCALVTPEGSVLHAERHPTGAGRGAAAVVETILEVAAGLAEKAAGDGLSPVAAGVAVPGVVDEATGAAVWAANIGFRDMPLRDLVSARLGVPAAVGHDVRAGGVAEARLGAGAGWRHVLFVAIGTGIAAAHVVGGVAFAGAHGAAGEIGHAVVRPGGPRCGCGQAGCLEAVASAASVARRYATAADPADQRKSSPRGSGAARTDKAAGPAGATAAQVAARARAGEARAVAVWDETVAALADGLLIAQALYDAEVVVLGGGLAEAGDLLLSPLREALRARLTFHREPVLVRAGLGDEAGCLGAGLLAIDAWKAAT